MPPSSLEQHALSNLAYIREVIDSGRFTGVPGLGGIAMGISALVAATAAAWMFPVASDGWLLVWLAAGAVAVVVGLVAVRRKVEAAGQSLSSGIGRRFLIGLVPALTAGAILTLALWLNNAPTLIPGVWMLLYGTAVAGVGGFSTVPVLRATGISFMAAGTIGLLCPPAWLDGLMALSFGGLHIGFGLWIVRRDQSPQQAAARATQLDRVIHGRIRLGMLSLLASRDSADFNEIKRVLSATDGNLSIHARKLEEAGYVRCDKTHDDRVPRSVFSLTPAGREALEQYLDHMEAVILAARGPK